MVLSVCALVFNQAEVENENGPGSGPGSQVDRPLRMGNVLSVSMCIWNESLPLAKVKWRIWASRGSKSL